MGKRILWLSLIILCVMVWAQFAPAEEKDYSNGLGLFRQ